MVQETIEEMVQFHIDPRAHHEDWDMDGLGERFFAVFGIKPEVGSIEKDFDLVEEALLALARDTYKAREAEFGSDTMRLLEKNFFLQVLDAQWKDHLYGMDQLREGIGLRGYGQKDPLSEYKIEGFGMFEEMMGRVREDTVRILYLVQMAEEDNIPQRRQQSFSMSRGSTEDLFGQRQASGQGPLPGPAQGQPQPVQQTVKRQGRKVGRNEPCPCGSGKKYKKCCGANA
jgi:preprotein translocase subunit SecA